MLKKVLVAAGAASLLSTGAQAACSYDNPVEVSSMSAAFEAWKAVTGAMAECGNFEANLDQEYRKKIGEAFAADPSLYEIGGISNSTVIPLLNEDLIRPLDSLVEQYGDHLNDNQLVRRDGEIVAIAMMVNTQHLMYRRDILNQLDIDPPKNYDQVLAAAEKIEEADLVQYPLGGTYKTGWNLGEEFVNMFLGMGGSFFTDGNRPNVNTQAGVDTLEMMADLKEYMHPEVLTHASTEVQQRMQQGKIAMANLWASRAGAMNNEEESEVVGKVEMAKAPAAKPGGIPAATIWWDGGVIAKNISDRKAEAAFRVMMEGMDKEMVQNNNDVAVWLIDGFEPTAISEGAIATANAGAKKYPASTAMGIMHTALGNNVADYLTGDQSAKATLADVEQAYLTAARDQGLVQ